MTEKLMIKPVPCDICGKILGDGVPREVIGSEDRTDVWLIVCPEHPKREKQIVFYAIARRKDAGWTQGPAMPMGPAEVPAVLIEGRQCNVCIDRDGKFYQCTIVRGHFGPHHFGKEVT